MNNSRVPYLPACFVLLLLCIAMAIFSLTVGAAPLTYGELWQGMINDHALVERMILYELRLPRIILALAVGAALGLSGAVMQSWLRNPLADAGLLGTSAMAALGAVGTLYFGMAAVVSWALPVGAIATALLGVGMLLLLLNKLTSTTGLILAGLAIQYIAASGVSLALNFAPNPHAALEIAFWMMGSLKDRSQEHVMLAVPFIAIGSLILLRLGRLLDALSLGEATAQSLGVNLRVLRFQAALGISFSVGAAVAVSGAVGFIGLIVPHLLRPLFGSLPSRILLPSALTGAAILLAADTAIRTIPFGQELKLGVATSIIGAPFFLYILIRMRKSPL